LVLDPFCGTGTVLLESILARRQAIGADSNPLARLIASVKTHSLSEKKLFNYLKYIITKSKQFKKHDIPSVVNIDYWYPQSTITALSRLLRSVNSIEEKKYRDFFLVCLSNCSKKTSFADQRIAVPVKLNPNRYEKGTTEYKIIKKRINEVKSLNVIEKFNLLSIENIRRIKSLPGLKTSSKIVSEDARNLTDNLSSRKKILDNSIDLIVTSPPYAGAQKYIRSSSLGIGWLTLADVAGLKVLDKKDIGREQYSPLECKKIISTGIQEADELLKKIYEINNVRGTIAGNYLKEMIVAIDESIRVLKPNGYFVLIVGNNQICKLEFNTQKFLTTYIEQRGLTCVLKLIDGIKSYGLMTKRNKTADIITREWIMVFKK
jgi:DNA modification methylase